MYVNRCLIVDKTCLKYIYEYAAFCIGVHNDVSAESKSFDINTYFLQLNHHCEDQLILYLTNCYVNYESLL